MRKARTRTILLVLPVATITLLGLPAEVGFVSPVELQENKRFYLTQSSLPVIVNKERTKNNTLTRKKTMTNEMARVLGHVSSLTDVVMFRDGDDDDDDGETCNLCGGSLSRVDGSLQCSSCGGWQAG